MELIAPLLEQVPYLALILQGLVAAHALAVFIVNLTPTPADDAIIATAYKYIEVLAGIITHKAKQ